MRRVQSPEVPVLLELAPRMLAGIGDRQVPKVAAAAAANLRSHLEEIGLPGRPSVKVRAAAGPAPVQLQVHGRRVPVLPQRSRRLWVAVAPPGRGRDEAGPAPDADGDWLAAHVAALDPDGDRPAWRRLADFLGLLPLEVVRAEPDCLLGPAQAAAYLAAAELQPPLSSADQLALLGSLLRLGVSVAARPLVIEAIRAGRAAGGEVTDIVESLFTMLRRDRIRLEVHPELLAALVPDQDRTDLSVYATEDPRTLEAFRWVEDSIFYDFGVRLPELVWAPTSSLPPGTVVVRINHQAGSPWVVGSTVSQPIEAVAASVHGELVPRLHQLLTVADVEYLLAELSGPLPDLVAAVTEHLHVADVARVMRGLLREGVSIRDSRSVLERMLQYDSVVVDVDGAEVVDGRLPITPSAPAGWDRSWEAQLEWVRGGLPALAGGGGARVQPRRVLPPEAEVSLVGSLTDPDRGQTADPAGIEAQLAALRAAAASGPVVLGAVWARRPLRERLARELPEAQVWSQFELWARTATAVPRAAPASNP